MQVRRLESALRKENKQHSTDGVDSSSTSKKRPSQAQNGNDSHVSKKSKAVDEEGVDKVHEGIQLFDAFGFSLPLFGS